VVDTSSNAGMPRSPGDGGEISKRRPYVGMTNPIHITIQGDADDPRCHMAAPPGTIIHRSPPLHPDDLDEIHGIPVTSLARTLVDLAEISDQDELRSYFTQARAQRRLDIDAVRASAERVEWRPSLPMLYEVIAEFEDRERK
jgi:hypothetical protein